MEKSRIELLGRDNFDTWKMQVQALLIKNDVWEYVSGKTVKPAGDTADDWISKDLKARSDLILSISPSQLKLVKNCETSRDVWLKLHEVFQSKGPARKATLLKYLMLHKMSSNDDVRDHVSSFFDTVDKLLDMEIKINDDLLTIMLLYSLPEEFENFRCAIESRDDLPKPETLRTKIIEEADARKSKLKQIDPDALVVKSKYRPQDKYKNPEFDGAKGKSFKCFKCKSIGHKASDCPKKKEYRPKGGMTNSMYVAMAVKSNKDVSNIWCLDSGCSSHMCSDPEKFEEIRSMEMKLNLADTSTTNVKGVAKMTDNGFKVIFRKDRADISDENGRIVMRAEKKNGLFYVTTSQNSANNVMKKESSTLMKWHQRFGHLNEQDLKKLNSTTERRRIEPEQPEQTIEDHAEEADDWEEDEETEEINADTRGNCESPEPSMMGNRMKRGRGRPRLLRTGSRGRPRKIYTMVPENEEMAGVVEISVKQALSSAQSGEWRAAIRKEFNSLLQNGTWVMEKRPKDKNVVGCRLILCNKFKANGELDRRKARLVARGFTQEYGVDYNETYAPVSRLSSLRMIMALAVQHDMEIIQMDVETAYLNGELEETIFMEAPECLEEILNDIVKEEKGKIKDSAEKMLKDLQTGKTVCRLKKSLYGLKQSGRQWYKKLDEKLKQLGMETTSADPCVYILDKEMKKFPYQSLIGSLMYLASGTRPDIAFSVNYLSQFNTKYDEATWKAAKHVLRYLKGTEDLKLVFKNDGKPLTGYVDSDWGNCPNDRRSYSGCLFNMSGSAISWMARKQRTVALSSTEAEYLGLSEAAKEAVYLKNFLTSVGFPPRDRIRIYNDNQGALQLVKNPTYHARTKHIDVRQQFIRQVTEEGVIEVEYLCTQEMPADYLTKPLPKRKHEDCLKKSGLAV
ncbi:Hydra magnipapillata [Nesidiocoris tenuis]|uniref:Hydra magnipapillata n=1 Tax=Nesidiocoris tenuis TaxID=355587 RepID=A0ABN7AJ41_9HEMI|nr:Hydra magnipapillata [Nesidiocoris tenuis]